MIGTIPSKILSLLILASVKKIKFMLKKKPSVKKSKKKKKNLGEGDDDDDEEGNGIDDDGNDTEDEEEDDDDVNQRLNRNNLNRAVDGLFNGEADKSFVVFMGNSNVQMEKR